VRQALKANPTIPTPPKNTTPVKRSLGRKTGLALFWNVAFLPVKFVLSLAVAIFIVRLFPENTYARLAAILSIQSSLGMFIDLGIERALPRFVGQVERTLGRGALRRLVFRVTLVKMALLAVLIITMTIFADAFTAWFKLGDDGRIFLALVAVLLVLGALYDVFTQVLYSFFKQKVTNSLDLIVSGLYPLLTLGLIVYPFQLQIYGVIVALLVTTVICVIIAGWQAALAAKEHAAEIRDEIVEATPAERRATTERFVRYAALMYFFNLTTWLYEPAFAILIFTYFGAATTAALVRLSYSFIKQLLKTLLTPFTGVQTPLFSAIHAENNPAKLQAAYSSISKLLIFLLVPGAIGAMLLTRNLTELLFLSDKPNAVVSPITLDLAIWATILTIFFTFLESLVSVPVTILQVYERYRLVILARSVPILLGGLLVIAAWLGWNVLAAITIMGAMAVGSRLIALYHVRRELGLRYPVAFLVKVLKASAVFALPVAVLVYAFPANWLTTFGAAALGGGIFLAVFRALGGFDPEDKQRLETMRLPFRKYLIRWL
jgi:O-antigen/teichoic acid export membrane protein